MASRGGGRGLGKDDDPSDLDAATEGIVLAGPGEGIVLAGPGEGIVLAGPGEGITARDHGSPTSEPIELDLPASGARAVDPAGAQDAAGDALRQADEPAKWAGDAPDHVSIDQPPPEAVPFDAADQERPPEPFAKDTAAWEVAAVEPPEPGADAFLDG